MAVKPGDILRSKYRIDALIGRGGMGQVFAATDLEARAQVAVKVVSRLLVDDVLMVRLHREAEAAQRIRSEYVPHVFEVSDTEDGETFLVMERLVGEPLSQRIRDNGALPWSEVRRIGEDVLRGLIDAHAAGVVHRDLKPSNVFLALKDARVRSMVLDFGVCKMAGIDAERLTGTGESIGTVAYMAPEQIRGAARVDHRADLFAFGVLVFEMLSGRLPHDGPSQMAILASKLENPPARLRACARVAIPEGTDELVARALERDPSARFQSAGELLDAWMRLASAPLVGVRVGAYDGPRAGVDPPTEISRPPPPYGQGVVSPSTGARNYGPALAAYSAAGVHGSLPPEPHPTQTSLTTHHPTRHSAGGGARFALYLAGAGLVAGIVVVGVSFTRKPRVHTTTESAPVTTTIEADASVAVLEPSSEAETSFELPPERARPDPPPHEASPAKAKPRVRRAPPPPPARAAEKPSGPHITSQPRY